MSDLEEKVFIMKCGKKYFCLRQRNNLIQCKNPPKKCISSNNVNKLEHRNSKNETSDTEKNLSPKHKLETEENEIYKMINKLENIISYKVAYFKWHISVFH